MTDKFYALTVILEKDIRDDEAEPILNAIRMIKGVQDVKGEVTNPDIWMAEERAKQQIKMDILKLLRPNGN